MKIMNFLVLGATGMAGHLIAIYLKEQGHDVTAFSRKPFVFCKNVIGDACDLKLIEELINNMRFDVVVNCIGILNQDAEHNKAQAVFLNSYLPHYLSHITEDLKTKVIQLSTDCVFSGKTGGYNEDSFRDAETFYGRSKALGEIENLKDLTFRTSIVGPDMKKDGLGLFNWFMKQREEIYGYSKVIWTGVTTITLAKAIEKAPKEDLVGIYHLVNGQLISKFELLQLFNKHFKSNRITINEYSGIIANKSLINNRKDFNFKIPSYEEMVLEMKEWVINHKNLYPHYFDY